MKKLSQMTDRMKEKYAELFIAAIDKGEASAWYRLIMEFHAIYIASRNPIRELIISFCGFCATSMATRRNTF